MRAEKEVSTQNAPLLAWVDVVQRTVPLALHRQRQLLAAFPRRDPLTKVPTADQKRESRTRPTQAVDRRRRGPRPVGWYVGGSLPLAALAYVVVRSIYDAELTQAGMLVAVEEPARWLAQTVTIHLPGFLAWLALAGAGGVFIHRLQSAIAARSSAEGLRTQRYRSVFASSSDAVLLMRQDGGIEDANPAAVALFGRSVQELRAGGRAAVVDPTDPRLGPALDERRRTGRFRGELRMKRSDGSTFETEIVSTMFRDRLGAEWTSMIVRDITDRTRAEQDLRRQAEELGAQARLLDLAHDTIMSRGLDGTVTFWNHGAVEMYGFERDEAVGAVSHELLRTRFPVPLETIMAGLRRDGRWDGDLEHTRKDGRRIVVTSRWAIQRDADNQPSGILEINRDVTEQRRAQEQLQLESRRQSALSRLALTANVADEAQTEILARAVETAAAGVPADEASIVLWDEARGEFVLSASTIASQAGMDTARSVRREGGATRWIVDHRAPLVVPDVSQDRFGANAMVTGAGIQAYAGVPVLYGEDAIGVLYALYRRPTDTSDGDIAFLREITRRTAVAISRQRLVEDLTRANRDLERSHRETDSILRSAADGVCGLDRSGRFTFVNAAAARILGFQQEELLGKNAHRAIHHHRIDGSLYPATDCPMRRTLDMGEPSVADDEVLWRKDGSPVEVEWSATAIAADGAVAGAVLTFRDIAQRKEVERMKDEFVSVASHELRTPLTSIRGALGLIAGGVFGGLPDGADEMIQTALRNTERLGRLVNDLLDLERMRAGRSHIERREVDISDLMRQAVQVMRPMADAAGVSLDVDVPASWISADPDRILQVLTNLISNAIKFSPRGESVRLDATRSDLELVVRVADRGHGIPADKLEAVFARFQQVNISDAKLRGGSGLGLAISREIAKQHGGRIWVESAVGRGSTFSLALPCPAPPAKVGAE